MCWFALLCDFRRVNRREQKRNQLWVSDNGSDLVYMTIKTGCIDSTYYRFLHAPNKVSKAIARLKFKAILSLMHIVRNLKTA